MTNHFPRGRAYGAHKRRERRATNTIPPPMWENRDAPINTGPHEPRTLDNTSKLLVKTLRLLIDDYGYTGVANTLELIYKEDND
jgi:hypothetical protein